MSAVQHRPGMAVRAAEALDEISGGRFALGLGAGHAGGATAFGFHTDKTVSGYLEALEIIVPLLRGHDAVTFEGEIHRATDAMVRPRGAPSRPGAAHAGRARSRTMTAAARHADTWSAFPTSSSYPETFRAMTAELDRICEGIGRDPASIGRSVGVIVEARIGKDRRADRFRRADHRFGRADHRRHCGLCRCRGDQSRDSSVATDNRGPRPAGPSLRELEVFENLS